ILLIISIQDFTYRAIHISLPLLLLIVALAANYLDFKLNFAHMLYNVLFIAINVLGLFLYFSIKEKRLYNPIDTMLGLGDILFFLAIAPLFSLQTFIVFFISGLIFSLVIHLISNLFKRIETIPLAGYLSVFLGLNICLKEFFKIEIPTL
ncbi:MAG: prepilin peptidase, partial [Bacteroidota bacterium]